MLYIELTAVDEDLKASVIGIDTDYEEVGWVIAEVIVEFAKKLHKPVDTILSYIKTYIDEPSDNENEVTNEDSV